MKDHPSQWIHSGLTCRDVAERTTGYLDHRLPVLTKIRFSLHLVSCTHCRSYLKQIVLVRDTLALLPKRYPSPIHRRRLRQQFHALHHV